MDKNILQQFYELLLSQDKDFEYIKKPTRSRNKKRSS